MAHFDRIKDGIVDFVTVGRDDDEGLKYAYDMRSVAELNNKMEDDMKIILAEYRLALKKNNANNP